MHCCQQSIKIPFFTANGLFGYTLKFLPISGENYHLDVNFNLDFSYYK